MFQYAGAAGRTRRERWWFAARDHPSGVLLAVQILGILILPYTAPSGAGRTAVSVFGLVVLSIAVLAVNRTPSTRRMALILATPVFLLTIAEPIWPDSDGVLVASYALHAVFYFYTAVSLLRYMFADAWVSRDELFATGACFTVLVWAYAYTFGVVQILFPGSFTMNGEVVLQLSWFELMFLSSTILTGTGLSDIAPAVEALEARSVLMLAMMTQVFYIALVVARLLGLTLVKFRR